MNQLINLIYVHTLKNKKKIKQSFIQKAKGRITGKYYITLCDYDLEYLDDDFTLRRTRTDAYLELSEESSKLPYIKIGYKTSLKCSLKRCIISIGEGIFGLLDATDIGRFYD